MIERPTARILLLDESGRLLLFQFHDPTLPQPQTFWATPGGGVEPGESFEEAAIREMREETGIELSALGPHVFEREKYLDQPGQSFRFDERYFVARVRGASLSFEGHTELERTNIIDHRWWSLDELEQTNEAIFPEAIVDLMQIALSLPA